MASGGIIGIGKTTNICTGNKKGKEIYEGRRDGKVKLRGEEMSFCVLAINFERSSEFLFRDRRGVKGGEKRWIQFI